MAELAGFDVIVEAHIDTIVDFINQYPFTNPIDGQPIYLLGGPFSTDLNVNLGGALGTVPMRLILSFDLEAVVHQPLANLVATFEGGASISAPPSLSHIGGQVTLTAKLKLASPPSPPGALQTTLPQTPVLDISASAVNVDVGASTRSTVDAALGTGAADLLQGALNNAFEFLLPALPVVKLPTAGAGFTVALGQDSSDPTVLAALPALAWIDAETMGLFGYYRAAATGGDISIKTAGDLGTEQEEFCYGQPGPVEVMPGRRSAILMSPEAFEQVIACPAIRQNVVPSLLLNQELPLWGEWVVSQQGAEIRQQMMANFGAYALEERQKDPGLNDLALWVRVELDIQRDIDAEVNRRATADAKAWINSAAAAGPETVSGQQAVVDATPPPCGNGTVEVARIPVDHAQSDVHPRLRRLAVELAAGKITADYRVDGLVELLPGDVEFSVSGTIDIVLSVTWDGRLAVEATAETPRPNIHGTGLTGTFIIALEGLFSGFWNGLMAFLALVLQGKLNAAITAFLTQKGVLWPSGTPKPIPAPTPQPLPNRLVDVEIEPESLFAAVLVCRELRFNDFHPSLVIDVTHDSRTASDVAPMQGKIALPATEWGCKAAEFRTVRTFWDETWSVRARLRDAPLPITILDWQIVLGNFSWETLGNARFLDPRPSWSGNPAEIQDGVVTLEGEVEHLDHVLLPYLHGPLSAARVPITVSGDAVNGWQIGASGTEGNFYLRLSADAKDGDGKLWHAETVIYHIGDQLEVPPEYLAYKADCDAKYAKWWRLRLDSLHLVGIATVTPGQPVMNGETREAIAVSTLVSGGDPTALQQLATASERYGPSFLSQLGQVAPLQLGNAGGSEGLT
jgi:hypothetical protein